MSEVSDNFVFRTGRYVGKSVGLVKKINPGYIDWVKENQPKMLEEGKSKPVAPRPAPKEIVDPPEGGGTKSAVMTPNLNFFNEGPNGKQNNNIEYGTNN